jgi:hypothetical protein
LRDGEAWADPVLGYPCHCANDRLDVTNPKDIQRDQFMQNIRNQTEECAHKLVRCASSAGTTELFQSCIPFAVDLALALKCTRVRNTGDPGFGILFEVQGRKHAGQFSLFATRPKFEKGVVALAVSDDAVGERAHELRARVHEIRRRYQGIALPENGLYKWPAIGFTTAAVGTQIIQAVSDMLLNRTPAEPRVAGLQLG